MFKKVAIVGAAGLLTAAVLTQTKVGSTWRISSTRPTSTSTRRSRRRKRSRRIKKEVATLDKDIDKAKGALAAEERRGRQAAQDRVERPAGTQTEKSRTSVEARGKMMKEATDDQVRQVGRPRRSTSTRPRSCSPTRSPPTRPSRRNSRPPRRCWPSASGPASLAEQHLQALITEKAELEAAVVELEADIKLVKIEQVQSKYQNDGTRMAEVKEDLAKLRKRIEIQREKLDLTKKWDTELGREQVGG